jgi:hypothetical protein
VQPNLQLPSANWLPPVQPKFFPDAISLPSDSRVPSATVAAMANKIGQNTFSREFLRTGQLAYYSNTWFISTLHKSICAAEPGAILVLKLKESLWFLLHERSPPHNVQSFHNIIMAPLKDEKSFSTYQIFQNYQLGSMYTHISLCLRQKFCIGAADAHCWWNKEHYFNVSTNTSREPCHMC